MVLLAPDIIKIIIVNISLLAIFALILLFKSEEKGIPQIFWFLIIILIPLLGPSVYTLKYYIKKYNY